MEVLGLMSLEDMYVGGDEGEEIEGDDERIGVGKAESAKQILSVKRLVGRDLSSLCTTNVKVVCKNRAGGITCAARRLAKAHHGYLLKP